MHRSESQTSPVYKSTNEPEGGQIIVKSKSSLDFKELKMHD